MKPTVWALSLLLAVSPHAVPVRASDECQPVTWPSGTYNKRATPTGVMHIIKARDGPEIGGGNLSPGDVNCRMPGRTYDDVNYYTCEELADNYGLLPEKLFALNPTLLPDCSNIQPNTAYCVAGCTFAPVLSCAIRKLINPPRSHRAAPCVGRAVRPTPQRCDLLGHRPAVLQCQHLHVRRHGGGLRRRDLL